MNNMIAQTVQIITARGIFEKAEPLAVGWILIGSFALLAVGLWIYLVLRAVPEIPNETYEGARTAGDTFEPLTTNDDDI